MLKNNFKIAWRNLVKDRLFTMLNLAGLTTGLATVLFIFLWVNDERSIDRFHANDSKLYQVLGNISLANGIFTQDYTPFPLAQSIAKDIPEVEMATAALPGGDDGIIRFGDKHIKAIPTYIDSNFFHVFSYPMTAGDSRQIFLNKYRILLSDEMAIKLFGSIQNSLGKTVEWGDENDPYIIAGVFKKPPVSSTTKFDVLFNMQLKVDRDPQNMLNWANSNSATYILIKKGTDINRLNKKIYGYLQTKASYAVLSLQAVKYSDQYLYNKYENGMQAGGRIEYVRLFSLIAVFILVIACINFMNLSTAKASGRAKEIGIKKVAGAGRFTLIVQFIGESMLLVSFAVLLALLIVLLLLPQFNHLTGKALAVEWNAGFVGSLLAVTILTGLIAGSYPAFYLSGFKPVTVLKGRLPASLAELWVRKGLVVFQFTLSVVFIIGVLTIYKQMSLVQSINLGYEKNNIISISNEGALHKSYGPFMNDLKKISGVTAASSLGADMTGGMSGRTEKVDWEGRRAGDTAYCMAIDMDYGMLEMLDIKMAGGRMFSQEPGIDSLSMILNETAVAAMGMKKPIGKTVTVWGRTYRIIGITKDFYFESLYEKVKPCFMRLRPGNYNIMVKIDQLRQKETLAAIHQLYNTYNPLSPFSFSFLDQNYQAMYVAEQRVATLSRLFAGLTILISCLGLFGLAAFTAEKRKKEIGIRKVIGASVSNVAMMLSTDFLRLVVLAILIAFPLAGWAFTQWLNSFAYRVHLGTAIFITAGLSIVGITLLTIGIQSVKAAMANPVHALRAE